MSNELNIMYRPYNDSDIPFIMNSWLKSIRNSIPYHYMSTTVYYAGMTKRITKILNRAGALIVCDPSSPNIILGYMVGELIDVGHDMEPVIHFAYVKHKFRKYGIYKGLYAKISGPEHKVPWATFKPLIVQKITTEFKVEQDGKTKKFGAGSHFVKQSPSGKRNDIRTEFNDFLLDIIDDYETLPIAHKAVI